MTSHPSLRISRLRALIDHPTTGAEERDVAERMLARILRSPRANDVGRNYGSRHHRVGRHASLQRIADMIRDDIAVARVAFATAGDVGGLAALDPLGDAPSEITIDVDTPHDAEIVITIGTVPVDWGWHRDNGMEAITPALQHLVDEIAQVMNDYNHGGRDSPKRFYGRVRLDGSTLVW